MCVKGGCTWMWTDVEVREHAWMCMNVLECAWRYVNCVDMDVDIH